MVDFLLLAVSLGMWVIGFILSVMNVMIMIDRHDFDRWTAFALAVGMALMTVSYVLKDIVVSYNVI